jgi:hypothetical protein
MAVDFGQSNDYTAIIAGETYATTERTLQRDWRGPKEMQVHEHRTYNYRITNAHRVALGTSYPLIVKQISVFLQVMPDADLIIDGTGVGRAVVDSLRASGMKPISISITPGLEVNKISWREYRVQKPELVTSLIMVAQQLRLKVAPEIKLRETHRTRDCSIYTARTATGIMTFEGVDGEHDDLVMALSCGIWHQEHRPAPGFVLPLIGTVF